MPINAARVLESDCSLKCLSIFYPGSYRLEIQSFLASDYKFNFYHYPYGRTGGIATYSGLQCGHGVSDSVVGRLSRMVEQFHNLTEPDLTSVRSPLPTAFGRIESTAIALIFARHNNLLTYQPTAKRWIHPQHLQCEEEKCSGGDSNQCTLLLFGVRAVKNP